VAQTEATYGPRDARYAAALNLLGGLHSTAGRTLEAEHALEVALRIYTEAYGPYHPTVAGMFVNLALAAERDGRYEEALWHYQQVIEIAVKLDAGIALGRPQPGIARLYLQRARVFELAGRYSEAEADCRAALDARVRGYGDDHVSVAEARVTLANVLAKMDRTNEAQSELEKAIAVHAAAEGREEELQRARTQLQALRRHRGSM
jgi:tetratricopeptide (TPR) repeat protein